MRGDKVVEEVMMGVAVEMAVEVAAEGEMVAEAAEDAVEIWDQERGFGRRCGLLNYYLIGQGN